MGEANRYPADGRRVLLLASYCGVSTAFARQFVPDGHPLVYLAVSVAVLIGVGCFVRDTFAEAKRGPR